MTTVTKFAQSHFLFEKPVGSDAEEEETRLLLDPGSYDYDPDLGGTRTLKDIPKVNCILVTHEHADHSYLPILKGIQDRDNPPLYTNAQCAKKLQNDGIKASVLAPGETITHAGWKVIGVEQKHGKLPSGDPEPKDVGFVIDGTFYSTGDSIPVPNMPRADVFLVPVAGPDMNFDTAKEMIRGVQPKVVIPMHYSNKAKYPIEDNDVAAFFVNGVETRYLEPGQSTTWS